MISSPTQSNVLQQLGNFLVEVLPAGTVVRVAQQNRVAEPKVGNFVLMTPIRVRRLETNIDGYGDAVFTGSIAGAVMTITDVDSRFPNARLHAGSRIQGVGIAANTTVLEILTGSGQVGTYALDRASTVGSETISAGSKQVVQHAEVTVQLDFHSADQTAFDMAMTVSSLMRDEFGVSQFANQDPNYGVVPLYADDPAQRPFLNDQQQVEWRWVLEALLQANVVVSVPQEFADSVDLDVVSVDATYPP